ncbi:MAG: GldG family protein, partial [Acidobacteriota bacterium]|nr:GldG family protein [Acidobacteriota bacterium]
MKKILQKLDILGLALVIAAVVWYSISNVWSQWNLALAIAGGVLVVIGLAANYKQIFASLGKRSAKYTANYAVSLVLVLAVVCGLNFIGQRHVKRFDVTGNSRFSLAPQTLRVLESLDKAGKDVDIKVFFPGGNHEPLQAMLTEYRALSGRLHYEFIDPDRQNDIAKRYDVTDYGTFQNPMSGESIKFGTVIVSYGDRREKIEKRSEEVEEQDLTNALIKVSRDKTKKVYFVQGHGEKNPDDSGQAGYSLAKKALEEQGYEVGTVHLAAEGKVPEDASVLVVAGLQNEPFPQELEFVKDFLNSGGGAIFMMDPGAPTLQGFFGDWGVQVDNDVVLDVSGAGRLMGASESMPLVLGYEQHPITDRFSAMTFFPLTRSIQPAESLPDGVTAQALFKSNANSWGETDLEQTSVDYNPEKDLPGPLSLAVAVSKEVAA